MSPLHSSCSGSSFSESHRQVGIGLGSSSPTDLGSSGGPTGGVASTEQFGGQEPMLPQQSLQGELPKIREETGSGEFGTQTAGGTPPLPYGTHPYFNISNRMSQVGGGGPPI